MDYTPFVPLTSNTEKVERKFTCTKPHLLFDYVQDHTDYMHTYSIEQKYHLGIKYRKYSYNGKVTYVKHVLISRSGFEKAVEISEIKQEEYDSIPNTHCINKIRSSYKISDASLILNIDTFCKNKMLVEVWGNKNNIDALRCYKPPKGLEEVTHNINYSNESIATNANNILARPLLIIEGTDMIGKSTVVKRLVKLGYICIDRDQYEFSNHVVNYERVTTCAARIRNSYINVPNYAIFVLYSTNEDILASRLKERMQLNQISRYDLECVEYNRIYRSITDTLENEHSINIKGIDVYSKTPDNIVDEIIQGIKHIE